MPRNVSELSEDELKKNFDYWLRRLATDRGNGQVNSLMLPTTHTFGSRLGKIKKLWKQILLDDKALLSEAARSEGSTYAISFISEPAKRQGLERFVFTWLGLHDPHHARAHHPAYGVFIKRDTEKFPACNASRRNLASPEAADAESPLSNILLPEDARVLAALELDTDERHKQDFWRYWGHPNYWISDYVSHHWEWKSEFHFLDRIPTTAFEAILWPWPQELVDPFAEGRLVPDSEDMAIFQRANPQCSIIRYEINYMDAPLGFVAAAANATADYISGGRWPLFVTCK